MATIDYTVTVSEGFRCPRGFPPGTATRKECLTCERLFQCLDEYMASGGIRDEMRAEARAYQRQVKRRKEEERKQRPKRKPQPLTATMEDQAIKAFGKRLAEETRATT